MTPKFELMPAFGTMRVHCGQDSYVETEQIPEILAPYVDPILHIHQGPDGYVRFGRKVDDGGWENLPALSMAKLGQ